MSWRWPCMWHLFQGFARGAAQAWKVPTKTLLLPLLKNMSGPAGSKSAAAMAAKAQKVLVSRLSETTQTCLASLLPHFERSLFWSFA
jgi:hypothetical protein